MATSLPRSNLRPRLKPNAQAVPARHPARLAIGPEKAPGDGTAGQGCGLDPAAQAPVAACSNRKRAIEQDLPTIAKASAYRQR